MSPERPDLTVRQVFDHYIELGLDEINKRTAEMRRRHLDLFAADYGHQKVSECRALDLHTFLKRHKEWKSEYTRRQISIAIKRAFNFCVDLELIDRNPYARCKHRDSLPIRRQPMNGGDFQACLRFAPPAWRRVLIFLKFTGCRPGELAAMRWRDVRFEDGFVHLEEHKTAKSTGRPRLIPLVPTTIKLLLWMRVRRATTVAWLLVRLLRHGPVKAGEVARFLSHYGVSDRAAYGTRQKLAVVKRWVGPPDPGPDAALADLAKRINEAYELCKSSSPRDAEQVRDVGRLLLEAKEMVPRRRFYAWAAANCSISARSVEKFMHNARPAGVHLRQPEVFRAGPGKSGCYVYELPPEYEEPEHSDDDRVFVTCLGNPLNRSNMALAMRRIRARAGISHRVIMYRLRHRFGLVGIKNRCNLKLLSLAMGHRSTVTTEHYVSEAGLTEEVKKAALLICYCEGAYTVQAPVIPRLIPAIDPPPVSEIPRSAEQLPTRYCQGGPRRPHVHAQLADVKMPVVGNQPAELRLEQLLRHFMGTISAHKPRAFLPTSSAEKLNPLHDAAFQAIAWARSRNPSLANAKDTDIYRWLSGQHDCPHRIPHQLGTFQRYLSAARMYHKARKRVNGQTNGDGSNGQANGQAGDTETQGRTS